MLSYYAFIVFMSIKVVYFIIFLDIKISLLFKKVLRLGGR